MPGSKPVATGGIPHEAQHIEHQKHDNHKGHEGARRKTANAFIGLLRVLSVLRGFMTLFC